MNMLTRWLADFRGQTPQLDFTPRAQQTIALARRIAVAHRGEGVELEHVLAGLLALNQGIGIRVLTKAGIDLPELKSATERSFPAGSGSGDATQLPYQKPVKLCLALALREAVSMRNSHCGTEHILLGILRHGEGPAFKILSDRGFALKPAREIIRMVQAEAIGGERKPPGS
jgi:ATP-dependent Clp protease ATP-binding subunit ClpC